jgi:3-phosphoshikimate 1-carboxyvinyltransferase
VKDVLKINGGGGLRGSIRIPGDKSISHRALILNALAEGEARVTGLLDSEDVQATAACLSQLGVEINSGRVTGSAGGLDAPAMALDCGNSGTTMRLLMGLIAGQDLTATLTGDASLQSRPMGRVAAPLGRLGAQFFGAVDTAPLTIRGGRLHNTYIASAVASAQVKTALMLAAVQGEGTLDFEEPSLSRDHTERMMRAMGVDFEDRITEDGRHHIRLVGPQRLQATDVDVPGDISSAAFFLVAASICPGSDLTLEHVGVNPSRTGILDALEMMGADIELCHLRVVSGEPVADIRVRGSQLKAATLDGPLIPRLVDELPVLGVAMAHAHGPSSVRNAAELRVKESDRVAGTVDIVSSLGAPALATPDGFDIVGMGGGVTQGISIDATGDHRIAMSALVAGLAAKGETRVFGGDSIASSFPGFLTLLEALRA